MNEIYDIQGFQITVVFKPGLVSIRCDSSLWKMADRRNRADFRDLAGRIYTRHLAAYGRALAIRERSFLLEIHGHIYADYYLLRYGRVCRGLLGARRYKRLLQSCEVIDCGDTQHDPNRWFWDAFSRLDGVVYPCFPRNISRKYAK